MKNNLHWRNATILGGILAFLSFQLVRWRAAIVIILLVVVFYYLPAYKKRKALFGDQVRSNEEIYITDFLCPILKEVFPQAELTLTADYPMNVLQVISPRSTKFDLFHQLSFHDEKNLVVANLYAYHIETRTKRDSSGETHTVREEVEDFAGQIFSLKAPISFPGHLRVVPTKKSLFLKRELKGDYPGAGPNEVQIETEDIQNNENYNIYCTDELSARKFLSPRVLEWFDNNISQNAVSMFVNNDRLYISLNTKYFLFMPPTSFDQIKQLSMVEEYKKLRMAVDYIRNFTKIFQIQE